MVKIVQKPVYAWKIKSLHKVNAQTAGQEISRLQAEKGEFFTPADLVHASEKPTAPLHPEFEWDNDKAAVEYRKDQARSLIDHVVIFQEQLEPADYTRAFVSVRTEEGPRFTSMNYAFSRPDLRKQVLDQALRDLEAFERRYCQYQELAEAVRSVKNAKRRLAKSPNYEMRA